eukprot:scaffold1034_cov418-Prasinococcus_capsulatus_cf.AAC.7
MAGVRPCRQGAVSQVRATSPYDGGACAKTTHCCAAAALRGGSCAQRRSERAGQHVCHGVCFARRRFSLCRPRPGQ